MSKVESQSTMRRTAPFQQHAKHNAKLKAKGRRERGQFAFLSNRAMNGIEASDIWHAATLVLLRKGAMIEAERLQDECVKSGDRAGCAIWAEVFDAAIDLARTKPTRGESIH